MVGVAPPITATLLHHYHSIPACGYLQHSSAVWACLVAEFPTNLLVTLRHGYKKRCWLSGRADLLLACFRRALMCAVHESYGVDTDSYTST